MLANQLIQVGEELGAGSLELGAGRGGLGSSQQMRACRMQVTGQFVPIVVFLCQTSGLATAVGQLGVVATHESDQRIGHRVDRNRTFPSPALRGSLGKMAGIGANDQNSAG